MISIQTKNKYKSIPWKDIVGMRDILIHNYLGVNLTQVWNTIDKDLPVLKGMLKD